MADNVTMTAVDGTDALAFVIIRPGETEGGVSIEAAANGMGKEQAAYVLRHVADQFDADTPSGESSVDPRAALKVLADLAGRWEQMAVHGDTAIGQFEGPAAATLDAEVGERGRTYRKTAADLREVLATGRIPHDLLTDAELGG
jgi:hypothetical protein